MAGVARAPTWWVISMWVGGNQRYWGVRPKKKGTGPLTTFLGHCHCTCPPLCARGGAERRII